MKKTYITPSIQVVPLPTYVMQQLSNTKKVPISIDDPNYVWDEGGGS